MIQNVKSKTYHFLRWIERYTNTDMVYVAHGGFWIFVHQIGNALLGFVVIVLFANLLDKGMYGKYTFVISIFSLLSIATLQGMGTPIISAVSRNNEGVVKQAWLLKFVGGLVGAFGAVVASVYYWYNDNTLLSGLMLLLAPFIPIIGSFSMYPYLFSGRKNFRAYAAWGLLVKVISVVSLSVTVLFTQNVVWLIVAYLAPLALAHTAVFFFVMRTASVNTQKEEGFLKNSLHLSFLTGLGVLTNHIDKVLVFHFLGTSQLAAYTIATTIPEQMKIPFRNLASLALPKYANLSLATIDKTIVKKTLFLSFFIVILIIAYTLFAPLLYQIFFNKYLDSVWVSQIFAFTLLGVLSIFPQTAMQANNTLPALYKYTIVNNVTQIVLMLIGLVYYGLLGLVVARVITRTLIVVSSFVFFWWAKRQDGYVVT